MFLARTWRGVHYSGVSVNGGFTVKAKDVRKNIVAFCMLSTIKIELLIFSIETSNNPLYTGVELV